MKTKSIFSVIFIVLFLLPAWAETPMMFQHFLKFTREGLVAKQLIPFEVALSENQEIYAIKTIPKNASARCLSMKDPGRFRFFYLKCDKASLVDLVVTVKSSEKYYSFKILSIPIAQPVFRSPGELNVTPPEEEGNPNLPSMAAIEGRSIWMSNGCVSCHGGFSGIDSTTIWSGQTTDASANGGFGNGIKNQFQRVTQMSAFNSNPSLTIPVLDKIAAYLNERNKDYGP